MDEMNVKVQDFKKMYLSFLESFLMFLYFSNLKLFSDAKACALLLVTFNCTIVNHI